MADRDQVMATAWLPRARLILTTPRAGRLEVENARLPSTRALPLSAFLRSPQQRSQQEAALPLLPRSFAVAELTHRCKNAHYAFTVAP